MTEINTDDTAMSFETESEEWRKINCDYKVKYEMLLKEISEIKEEALDDIANINDEEIYWQSVGKLYVTERLIKNEV